VVLLVSSVSLLLENLTTPAIFASGLIKKERKEASKEERRRLTAICKIKKCGQSFSANSESKVKTSTATLKKIK